MSKAPLMPMATAVWLVENTSLTFKQIADFCKLHEVEIQGIADGEVAKGIVGYNPVISGQLSDEEISKLVQDGIAAVSAESMKDMGKLMGYLKPLFEGKADMSTVSKLVKELLS